MKNKKGISLIVLVITIIVIIILAGAVILSLANNNPIESANEAVFKANVAEYNSELAMAIANEYLQNSSFDSATFDAGVWDGIGDETGTIKQFITSMSEVDAAKFTIQDGKLIYVGEDDTEKVWLAEIEINSEVFVIEANIPVLTTGMTAKKWNGSSWDTVSSPDTDTTWYDYENKEWANAQTVDGSMWVWIPRYEYQILTPHSLTAQTIAVNFLMNTEATATSGYTIHPAFTFGSTELKGIWVAKFEASGTTSAVDVKPNVTSLRSISINAMFTACRNMETTNGTRYGWGTSGTGIDTHLMKNIEWGTVVYLSQSIYGKNSEVWINPNINYITGQAGTSASALGTTSTYAYDNATYGVQASTTGNISGIYDMSGGTWEYTAAYVNNGHSNLTTYGLSLVNAASQYKDIYIQGSSDTITLNYEANSSKKGDAVYETSTSGTGGATAWFGDYATMPCSSDPFFLRGGGYGGTTGVGAFNFNCQNGGPSAMGFRPVLVLSGTL
ncbi:MAG: hypothetical protein PHD15_04375 [Clostridia bacterium]|nr:hypothetical protein [Clostridia bacterium]MDD4386975.1 hypothetical protein [Clostridia bacterium]